MYALVSPNNPWVNPPNPGTHRPTGLGTSAEQRDADVVWADQNRVYQSQANVHLAVIEWLNTVVPKAYRPLITGKFNATQAIVDIFHTFRQKYPAGPDDKAAMEQMMNKPWVPASKTYEEFMMRLQDVFEWMALNPPAYTEDQLVDKALLAIKKCGLFESAVVAWTALPDHSWASLKQHFETAVSNRMQSGLGTAGTHNYVANVEEAVEDDDTSIESTQRYLGGIQLANNTNVETMNNNLNQVTAWQASMNQELARIHQALAARPPPAVAFQPQQYAPPPPPMQPNYALQGQGVPPPATYPTPHINKVITAGIITTMEEAVATEDVDVDATVGVDVADEEDVETATPVMVVQ